VGRKEAEGRRRKDEFIRMEDGGLFNDANSITLTELGRPSSEGSREEEM
jgi:hypothetical protein